MDPTQETTWMFVAFFALLLALWVFWWLKVIFAETRLGLCPPGPASSRVPKKARQGRETRKTWKTWRRFAGILLTRALVSIRHLAILSGFC